MSQSRREEKRAIRDTSAESQLDREEVNELPASVAGLGRRCSQPVPSNGKE